MKKILSIITICVVVTYTTFSQTKTNNKMNTIVLVHGAWLDASSWDKVAPLLKASGHEVIIVTLPGHGKDNTPYDKIQLQSYVDVVKKAIGSRTNVTLVGHSMGGIVISETAEQIPAQIKNLVYVAGFLPRNGETLLTLANQPENKESLLGQYIRPDEKTGSAGIAKEGIVPSFVADGSQADKDKVLAGYKPDPLIPFATPVKLTDANFGKVNKCYIYTENDKAVSYPLQQAMVKNSNVMRTYTLPSSHTVFLHLPGVLAAAILREAESADTSTASAQSR
ncbi:MAG TPA: alpha/beta hydrolase [Chitinophagales bacterium]|nr:alpha/beta hydrolase [Chitinophagales bacterium]